MAVLKAVAVAGGLGALALWWLWYFWRHDPGEREPSRPIILTAGLGVVAGVVCAWYRAATGQSLGWMTGLLNALPFWRALLESSLRIGLVEELAKFLPVWLYSLRSGFFDEPGDGFVYATASAVGFATSEAAFVLQPGLDIRTMVGVIALPVTHGLFSSAWGWGLGARSRWGSSSVPCVIAGIGVASLAHGIYDVVLLRREVPNPLVVLLVLAIWLWFMKATAPRASEPLAPDSHLIA